MDFLLSIFLGAISNALYDAGKFLFSCCNKKNPFENGPGLKAV